jgi:hypothetical protein
MKKIYIIGTAHKLQTSNGCRTRDLEAFKDYLREVCKRTSIKAIAEEMSLEALTESNMTESTCEAITKELSLQHQYSDPDRATRQRLGIRQENDLRAEGFLKNWSGEELQRNICVEHEKREKYWLDQIKVLSNYPLLFVCGANHINSFGMLLRSQGLNFQILADDWAPNKRLHLIADKSGSR